MFAKAVKTDTSFHYIIVFLNSMNIAHNTIIMKNNVLHVKMDSFLHLIQDSVAGTIS